MGEGGGAGSVGGEGVRSREGSWPRGASLLERALAYVVDSVVTFAVWGLLVLVVAGFEWGRVVEEAWLGVLAGFLFLLVPFVYFVVLEWLGGATVGKALLGLRVRSVGLERAGLFAVVVRNTLRLAWGVGPVGPLFLLLDAVLVHQGERDQRVGDIAGETVVVREGRAVFEP